MSIQDNNTPHAIEITDEDDESSVINSITINATAEPSSTARIPRVPTMVKDKQDHEKYYVPNVVSIGPYHHGNPKLEFVENLKPVFTMKLVSNNEETLRVLYRNLSEHTMVQDLRNYYETNSTNEFENKVFIQMMLLDACFILYYLLFIFGQPENRQELKNC
ncbi:hypothetical protein HanRHA438_Chr01g0012401 [Helianthus annuus]|uniref:Uncharacterized protein n=1 Tax=Helianthus annuus TaxID=4232 RepID=A0A9K3JVB8_HELAN|nr:hypothetical protein HanXRQr2_Chr01g0011991 [Helianthus annuus]KAJ0610972.1 hypothetical protein HanHA300_Chr01g0009901 [Helianthus annuus]KAJ0782571.1 hypothetical protein HanLR1_Chr01g0009741 [Helianthus annuus]KAJ0804052.1 hypothetical protein HanLR1_Chr00c1496g0808171 [Helianthus annuus]KAJ0947190.1 hypothetical protein HanRHA438_Chr01g0012401 [Helianthus annuus]